MTAIVGQSLTIFGVALRFMELNEQWVAELKLSYLRQQVNKGLTQLDDGQGLNVDSRAR